MAGKTKTDRAVVALRRAIFDGVYVPGQRLPVAELIQSLQMSPTPIREALRLLQAAGLVEYQPHRGMVVTAPAPGRAQEVFELRQALEALTAAKAASAASDAQLEQLEDHFDHLRAMAMAESTGVRAQRRHWAEAVKVLNLVRTASNSALFVDFLERLDALSPVRPPSGGLGLAELGAVVNAVVGREPEQADAAMRQYVTMLDRKASCVEAGDG